jgi:IS30 family transposase
MGWSPEQIARRMEREGSEHALSAESIYRHVYGPAGRRAGLPRLLAQRKSKRGRRRRNGRREPAIPNRMPIHQRPTKAHLRSQFGHWEGDLMHFRRQRDILLTLQERKTRLMLGRRLCGKDADGTAAAVSNELAGLPARARRTITYDNGGEFAHHEDVTEHIGLRAYFCDPHSPWQRGGIENANGRLRRDLPRKTSLDGYTPADIDDVIWNLNSTPRKCLNYQTPIEAFAANLGVALEM